MCWVRKAFHESFCIELHMRLVRLSLFSDIIACDRQNIHVPFWIQASIDLLHMTSIWRILRRCCKMWRNCFSWTAVIWEFCFGQCTSAHVLSRLILSQTFSIKWQLLIIQYPCTTGSAVVVPHHTTPAGVFWFPAPQYRISVLLSIARRLRQPLSFTMSHLCLSFC